MSEQAEKQRSVKNYTLCGCERSSAVDPKLKQRLFYPHIFLNTSGQNVELKIEKQRLIGFSRAPTFKKEQNGNQNAPN